MKEEPRLSLLLFVLKIVRAWPSSEREDHLSEYAAGCRTGGEDAAGEGGGAIETARAENAVGAAIVDVVEHVQGLHAEGQRVLAASAGAAAEHAAHAAPAAAAQAARTEAASGRSAAPTAAIHVRPAAIGTCGVTGFRTKAPTAADAQVDGNRCGTGALVGGDQSLARNRLGIETAEARGRDVAGRVGLAVGGCGNTRALIVKVIQRIVGKRDIERLARIRNQEGVEAESPRTLVVGHREELVARIEGGWAVILGEIVGVGYVGAGAPVAVRETQCVEAHQAQVLCDPRIDA